VPANDRAEKGLPFMAVGASEASPIFGGDPIVVRCFSKSQACTKVHGRARADIFSGVLPRFCPRVCVGNLAAVWAAVLRILEVDKGAVPEVAVGALQSHFLLRALKAA